MDADRFIERVEEGRAGPAGRVVTHIPRVGATQAGIGVIWEVMDTNRVNAEATLSDNGMALIGAIVTDFTTAVKNGDTIQDEGDEVEYIIRKSKTLSNVVYNLTVESGDMVERTAPNYRTVT